MAKSRKCNPSSGFRPLCSYSVSLMGFVALCTLVHVAPIILRHVNPIRIGAFQRHTGHGRLVDGELDHAGLEIVFGRALVVALYPACVKSRTPMPSAYTTGAGMGGA